MAFEDALQHLSLRVSDRDPVDWRRALEDTAPAAVERRILEQLRIVGEIAAWHTGGGAPATAESTAALASDAALTAGLTSAVSTADNPGAAVPPVWGHLELCERVGNGAFGEVYRAWDTALRREVALKLLQLEDSASPGTGAGAALEEARNLARIRHPNVVQVYGAEQHDGRVGLWMEFVRGRTLDAFVREHGPFGAREAALVGQELCRALTAVHRAGLIHRDVKARNVMREDGGRIVLMDFGTGWERNPDPGTRPHIAGTPVYMAPEVLQGASATPQSDLFALGVLLHYLVTAQFPVEAATVDELRRAHAAGQVTLLREVRPDLPEPYLQVVEAALAPDPAHRFASAGQMERALGATLGIAPAAGNAEAPAEMQPAASTAGVVEPASGERLPRRRPVLVAGLVAAVVVAGVFALQLRRPASDTARTPPRATALPKQSAIPAVSDGYRVEAGFMRRRSGARTALDPGGQVAPGDGLSLEIQSSAPVYVYVVNEDERGECYLLFPLPGFETANPLKPDIKHQLPGRRAGGTLVDWEVSSAGGKEHLLVVASPQRLAEFEADLLALPRAESGGAAQYAQLSQASKLRLRGIGSLQEVGDSGPGPNSNGRLAALAAQLPRTAEVVEGVWVRQVEFENPVQH